MQIKYKNKGLTFKINTIQVVCQRLLICNWLEELQMNKWCLICAFGLVVILIRHPSENTAGS